MMKKVSSGMVATSALSQGFPDCVGFSEMYSLELRSGSVQCDVVRPIKFHGFVATIAPFWDVV